MKKFQFLLVVLALIIAACSSSDDGNNSETGDNFDREALLVNIADNIVIPAYQNFSEDMTVLKTAASDFVAITDETNLISLREAWSTAYISWQSVSMFEIGLAESLSYRNFMNVFPVNETNIEANISNGNYDLTAVSQQDEQGFGALDYLINGLFDPTDGISDSDAAVVAVFINEVNGTDYKTYLTDIVNRMDDLTTQVFNDWTGDYRDVFVNNSGSTATSSLDKLVNDIIFHYEKHLRAGKIGIPAGVFSATTLEDTVEALYIEDLSKTLFNANLNALQDFFNGVHFGSATRGDSLRTYLNFLNTITDGENLSDIINNQFDVSRTFASNLDDNFSAQVRANNTAMLETYDELQRNVVFLKVDMLQAISVNVDFVDADGD